MTTFQFRLFIIVLGVLMITGVQPGNSAPLEHAFLANPSQEINTNQSSRPPGSMVSALEKSKIATAYGKLSLSFEINEGQSDSQVKFLSRGNGYTLFLTSEEAVLRLNKRTVEHGKKSRTRGQELMKEEKLAKPEPVTRLSMRLQSSNQNSKIVGIDELPGKSNYFIGKDPNKWRTNVSHYGKVKYEEVYPGIDLIYYGNQSQLEYDFIVAPGADPTVIRLGFQGVDKAFLTERGDLVLKKEDKEILLEAPVIYQEINGMKKRISGKYLFHEKNQVSFQVAKYDTGKPLIIDPVLSYSTYFGGSHFDAGEDIAVDGSGNAYVTGSTQSIDFPLAGNILNGAWDAFGECPKLS